MRARGISVRLFERKILIRLWLKNESRLNSNLFSGFFFQRKTDHSFLIGQDSLVISKDVSQRFL